MPDFLPQGDAALLDWSTSFDRQVNADPSGLGLSPQQAAEYRTLHLAFADAYLAAAAPPTRTRGAVASKNAARSALKQKARQLAGIVKSQPCLTEAERVALSLLGGRGGRRVAHATPTQPPSITVAPGAAGYAVRVTLRDRTSPTRTGKPRGVGAAAVLTFVGDAPPADVRQWRLAEQTTRTMTSVNFPASVPAGSRVWVCARWMSPTRQGGPCSEPVGTWLMGGVATRAG